jgi:hypothetical protein
LAVLHIYLTDCIFGMRFRLAVCYVILSSVSTRKVILPTLNLHGSRLPARKEWPRARLWRGLACENITQAIANDLLRYALRQLGDVVLHIHDEIVLEVPEADAEAAAARLVHIMCDAATLGNRATPER